MGSMSYQNEILVYDAAKQGRLTRKRGDNVTTDSFSLNVLLLMAHVTMQYPPNEKMRREHTPSRLYTGGWRMISDTLGMDLIDHGKTLELSRQGGTALDDEREKRRATAKARIIKAWAFLREQRLIKQLYPQSLGKNAGYLLLIGDHEENVKVEEWARECLAWKGGK